MTVASSKKFGIASRLINGVLSIKPLANLAKHKAREMMIKRGATIGVYWTEEVKALQEKDLETEKAKIENLQLQYPKYYLKSFHAYEKGNLSWEAATEVEVAAKTVHSSIWPEAGAEGDAKLRESYHNILKTQIKIEPKEIADLGCSVGMSSFAMQKIYPQANITGVDLSPYYLAIANLRARENEENQGKFKWVHAPAENTGLAAESFDLVSIFLLFHELPQTATKAVLKEAKRLLRPGGYVAFMDMNPKSEIYAQMPTYILTLLKSTEPYLDEYFSLDIEQAFIEAGFEKPTISINTHRHRTVIAKPSMAK
jgi:ubiquinone/menaquinone biosynthesis C-methylase UbiE